MWEPQLSCWVLRRKQMAMVSVFWSDVNDLNQMVTEKQMFVNNLQKKNNGLYKQIIWLCVLSAYLNNISGIWCLSVYLFEISMYQLKPQYTESTYIGDKRMKNIYQLYKINWNWWMKEMHSMLYKECSLIYIILPDTYLTFTA